MYICYMAYRTLDPRYTLLYIPIRVLYHTDLQTLFTISSKRTLICLKLRWVTPLPTKVTHVILEFMSIKLRAQTIPNAALVLKAL